MAEQSRQASGLALMALFTLWCLGLGIGFAIVTAVAFNDLGLWRVGLFICIAVLLLAAGVRTASELVRRLRRVDSRP
jgi:hypothetical protein